MSGQGSSAGVFFCNSHLCDGSRVEVDRLGQIRGQLGPGPGVQVQLPDGVEDLLPVKAADQSYNWTWTEKRRKRLLTVYFGAFLDSATRVAEYKTFTLFYLWL